MYQERRKRTVFSSPGLEGERHKEAATRAWIALVMGRKGRRVAGGDFLPNHRERIPPAATKPGAVSRRPVIVDLGAQGRLFPRRLGGAGLAEDESSAEGSTEAPPERVARKFLALKE